MRRLTTLFALTTVVATTALATLPAGAITNGELDGDRHPNVAFIGCALADGTVFPGPTGALISSTVVLTAGHATAGAEFDCPTGMFVSFDPAFDPETSKRYPVSRFVTHPEFSFTNLANDVGVLILKKPVRGIEPIELPTERLLDELKLAGELQRQAFVAVGYGWDVDCATKPCSFIADWVRRYAPESFSGLASEFITFQWNTTATGEGGACGGDSGGPHFLGDTNMSVGVTSWATGGWNNLCEAVGGVQRIDTPVIRSFLGRFVQLP